MKDAEVINLFAGEIFISYSQFYIEPEDPKDNKSLEDQFFEQENGLCGASVEGRLFFTARPTDSHISLTIDLFKKAPKIHREYKDIVEVSFRCGQDPVFLCHWGHEIEYHLNIPSGDYRVRYCINDIDMEYDPSTEDEDDDCSNPVPGQEYLIQIWPQNLTADKILQTETTGGRYWHRVRKNT